MKEYSSPRNSNTRQGAKAERPPRLFFSLRSSTIETQYALIEQARAARTASIAPKNEDPRREGINFISEEGVAVMPNRDPRPPTKATSKRQSLCPDGSDRASQARFLVPRPGD